MRRRESYKSTLEEPTDDFIVWWSPCGKDRESGADTGGHPDAFRVWARKDPGRWVRRSFGISALMAWNAQCYRSEYLRWIDAGRPEQEEFISLAATLERQKQFWHDLKPIIAKIGKPMPKVLPLDYDKAEMPF